MRNGGVQRKRHLPQVTWEMSGGPRLLMPSVLFPVSPSQAPGLGFARPGLEEEVGILGQAGA